MRPLIFLFAMACGPRAAPIESGSYVPVDPARAHGLEGVNLTLDDGLAFFVTPDKVYEREVTVLDEDQWREDCAKNAEDEGNPEETLAVDGTEMAWPAMTVVLTSLSGACDHEGGMRIIGTSAEGAAELEVILTPF